MSKKIIKENQRFRGIEVYLLLAFLAVGLTYRFVQQFVTNSTGQNIPTLAFFSFLLLLAGAFYYFISLRLRVVVSEKGLRYKYFPWHPSKHKINWEDVDKYEFIETSEAARLSGWGMYTTPEEKRISLCGRNGLHIITKDGEDIFIGSRQIVEHKEEIIEFLEKK